MRRGQTCGLTSAQARLLDGHRRGLARVVRMFSEKSGRGPAEIMFVFAHQLSNVGSIAAEKLGDQPILGTEAVIIPGLAQDLVTWLGRLTLRGPVDDCTHGEGVAVTIIDDHNEMALCRLACPVHAAGSMCQIRSIILPE